MRFDSSDEPVTHFLAGWMVAQFADQELPRGPALIVLAGVAPDLDGLGIVPELLTRNSAHPLLWFSEYHHVLGHNLGFCLVTAVAAYWLSGRSWKIAALATVAFQLHLLCDLLGARGPDGYQWPIPFLSPFSNSGQLTWHGQWALNAWQNYCLTIVLLAITFAFSQGSSPVRMFSTNADRVFVETLRRRFGR